MDAIARQELRRRQPHQLAQPRDNGGRERLQPRLPVGGGWQAAARRLERRCALYRRLTRKVEANARHRQFVIGFAQNAAQLAARAEQVVGPFQPDTFGAV